MSAYAIVAIGLMAIIFIILVAKKFEHKVHFSVKFLTRTGVFAAISMVLYMIPVLKFRLPIFPSFLEIHLSEVPIMIAGFAYGPWSAIIIIIVRTLAKLPLTITLGVGEFIDFMYSLVFVLPAALIYRKHRTLKGVLAGLGIATVIQVIFSAFVTTFVMLEVYMQIAHYPEAAILKMCQEVNPNITDLRWPFFFFVGLPFNALKDGIVIAVTFILYKRLHMIVDKL